MTKLARPLAALAQVHVLLVFCALAPACGSDDPPDATAAEFVGTWTMSSGEATAKCGFPLPGQALAGSQVTLTAASDAALVVDVRDCRLLFDIAGRSARARAGQTCTTSFPVSGQETTIMLNVAAASFTLSADGKTGTLAMNGMASVASFPIPCGYEASGSASKAAPQ